MKLIIITGNSAVGKMTIGQELCKHLDLGLMHNHSMIEPTLEIFGYYNPVIITKLRRVIFEEYPKTASDGLVFTCMLDWDREDEITWLNSLIDLFKANDIDDTEVYIVNLYATLDTRLNRNTSENRLKHKPSKRNIEGSTQRLLEDDISGRYECSEEEVMKNFDINGFISINNENLTVEEQTRMIIDKLSIGERKV